MGCLSTLAPVRFCTSISPIDILASAKFALVCLIHSLLLLSPEQQVETCFLARLQALQDTIQGIVDMVGTPPYIASCIEVWICIGAAIGLQSLNLQPSLDNLQIYVALRPTMHHSAQTFSFLGFFVPSPEPTTFLNNLRDAVDTLRDLQLLIDCNQESDTYQQLASTLMYFAELELMNAVHTLDPTSLPAAPIPPAAPVPVLSSQSQDSHISSHFPILHLKFFVA